MSTTGNFSLNRSDKMTTQMIRASVTFLDNQLKMVDMIKEPMTQNTVFFASTFMSSLNVIFAGIDAFIEDALETNKLKKQEGMVHPDLNAKSTMIDLSWIEQYRVVRKKFEDHLQKFLEWINSPIYSPDHPFNENVVKEAKNHFNENKK